MQLHSSTFFQRLRESSLAAASLLRKEIYIDRDQDDDIREKWNRICPFRDVGAQFFIGSMGTGEAVCAISNFARAPGEERNDGLLAFVPFAQPRSSLFFAPPRRNPTGCESEVIHARINGEGGGRGMVAPLRPVS